jgi:leader peptidase (prepilin peptidase)/N-methyltransferase
VKKGFCYFLPNIKFIMRIFLFVTGLIIGSFSNVVIYRLPRKISLVSPGSACCYCNNKLQVPDLFPLISFLLLRGRCRYCGGRIPWRYPLVELLMALLLLLCHAYFGLSPFFYKYAATLGLLLIISFIDIEHGIIPNRLILLLLVWSVAWQLLYPDGSLEGASLGLLVGGGLFYLIAALSKGGMGGGDIKLMAALGFATGWPLVFVVFLLAFLLGSVVGIFLLVGRRKIWGDSLPFGPFLSFAFLISVFWGPLIWNWYLFYL